MEQPNGIVDLGDVAARLEAQEDERVIREGKESEARLAVFDKQMQRMFKGIVPRPQRHKLLRKAVADYEARDE